MEDYIPCRYAISKLWAFDHVENKDTVYCRKDCMRRFCEFLREHTKNFEKKKYVFANKRWITSRYKRMLYLWKNNLKKAL